MGFFQDLREDLSQAVNELMPDEDVLQDEDVSEAENLENVDEEQEEYGLEDAEEVETLDGKELDALVSEAIGEELETQEDEELKLLEEQLEEQLMAFEKTQNEKRRRMPEEPKMMESQRVYEIPDEVVSDMLKSEETVGEVLEKVNAESKVKEKKMTRDVSKEAKEYSRMADHMMKLTGVAIDETSIITAGMTITGNVASKGSLEVEGSIIGDVETLGKLDVKGTIKGNSKAAEVFAESAKITGEVHSEGTIKIGQSSVIIGNIYGKNAVIAGAVKGDIDVQGPVVLDTSAIVMGNIKSKSVQINNGAVIEGLCSQCYADVSPTTFFDEYKG